MHLQYFGLVRWQHMHRLVSLDGALHVLSYYLELALLDLLTCMSIVLPLLECMCPDIACV